MIKEGVCLEKDMRYSDGSDRGGMADVYKGKGS